MKNYRAELVGLFGDPVDGNPTGVMMETAFVDKGLNFRYVTMKVKEEDLEAVTADLCAVLEDALAAFQTMRAKEGEQMAKDIRGRLATIEMLTGRIEKRSPETVAEYRSRLEQRLH